MKIPVKLMLVDLRLYARLRIDCSAIHMYVHMHVEPFFRRVLLSTGFIAVRPLKKQVYKSRYIYADIKCERSMLL